MRADGAFGEKIDVRGEGGGGTGTTQDLRLVVDTQMNGGFRMRL